MAQEEKQLLIKDLCARLPYEVKCHFKYGAAEDDVTLGCIDNGVARFEYGLYGRFHVSIDADYIKPYLRSIDDISDEESNEMEYLLNRHNIEDFLDFVHSHYIDWRNLIEKSLALEAPENMYNIPI